MKYLLQVLHSNYGEQVYGPKRQISYSNYEKQQIVIKLKRSRSNNYCSKFHTRTMRSKCIFPKYRPNLLFFSIIPRHTVVGVQCFSFAFFQRLGIFGLLFCSCVLDFFRIFFSLRPNCRNLFTRPSLPHTG